jgi:hypothetical protein
MHTGTATGATATATGQIATATDLLCPPIPDDTKPQTRCRRRREESPLPVSVTCGRHIRFQDFSVSVFSVFPRFKPIQAKSFGGSGRWDIRGGTLTSGGHNITKVGANQFSLVGDTVDSTLGDVEVRQGTFVRPGMNHRLGDDA